MESAFLDPCAGDGEAVCTIAKSLYPEKSIKFKVYACEMERSRYEGIVARRGHDAPWANLEAVHGDAFKLIWERKGNYSSRCGVQVLFLNPPYDQDSLFKRLEERFLHRFASCLETGGVLVFVVPYYALQASAVTLGTHFEDLHCFRFPGEDFDAFKQVVLIGTKAERPFGADEKVVSQVEEWARNADGIPELPENPSPVVSIPCHKEYEIGFDSFRVAPLDVKSVLSQYQPWHTTDRGGKPQPIHGIFPEGESITRTYPMAMPPRPAHIAAGVAAGVFNGARIEPDDPKSRLPHLLVKGVFDREFVSVDEKKNKEGETTGVVQVQQPKLVITALDLSTKKFHTIKSSADRSTAVSIDKMTTADLLASYGRSLMRVMLAQCPVLHDPSSKEGRVEIPKLGRSLYKAQTEAVMASVKLLGGVGASKIERKGKAVFVLGEIGSGKCLGLGTPVLRFDGTVVAVEDVRNGDLLMGPDSTPRRVQGTTRGKGPLFKIVPTVGEPWVCNDAHILTLVHTMSDNVFDIPLQEYRTSKRLKRQLSRGNRTTHPVTEFKQFFPAGGVDFPPISPPTIDPYFLGVWYGDGTKGGPEEWLKGVDVTSDDPEIVEMLRALATEYALEVREGGGVDKCPTYALSTGRIGGEPNPLLDLLRTAYEKGLGLPCTCLLGDRDVRRAFLAGLLDSDGHYASKGFDFIQKRKKWSEDVCFLARSLGIRATMAKAYKSAYQTGPKSLYWRVTLSGDFTGIPTRILRKRAEPRADRRRNKVADPTSGTRRTRRVNRTGISIEPIGVGEYAGFTLDGDGRFLLGDFTVTHNTSVALATAHTIGAKRILVMCPPHLLQGWTEQCAAVLPWAKTKVLSTVSDVDELAEAGDETIVAIMSREAAKLGHAWTSLAVRCPKCGAEVPPGDHAKTRYQCEARTIEPNDEMARDAYGMALRLFPVDPTRHPMDQIFRGLHHKRMREALKERPKSWESVRTSFAPLVEKYFDPKADDGRHELFMFLLTAVGDDQLIGECARKFYLSCADDSTWEASKPRERARDMLLLMKAGPLQDAIVSELKAMPAKEGYSYYSGPDTWARWATARNEIAEGKSSIYGYNVKVDEQGQVGFNKKAKGSLDAAFAALEKLSLLGKWKASRECGEFLYQAIPEPRRVALSPYLAKRFPNFFDVFVLDEQHEYSGDSSAQGFAAHRITNLGIPTIGLTGSVMGGYAESLFANQWALDPSFRKEFGRDQRNEFVRRYGYLKQLVEDKNKDTGKVVAYGSMSDRVERSARTIGNAPGVLPLFVLRYLLKMSVTLHKADLALDLPPRHDIVERIQPSSEQRKWLNHLQSALVSRIKKDQFTDKAGKLWGQLAELPSYLDRCTADVGNQDDGGYVIAYPESEGGQMVASAPPMKASEILPKERWMLDTIAKELAEGRRVMVMAWHVKLLPRLAWLIGREIGEKVPILDPAKVPTAKRQAWIDKEIVKKRHNVMVCNPVAIQTGLNNLVWFSSQIWMQNPGVNAITFRQATGRIDRIGQTKESRVYFPIYEGTTQEQLHRLLMLKVGVSMSTDGLDGDAAMVAAGVGGADGFSALSVGRQLFELLSGEGPNLI